MISNESLKEGITVVVCCYNAESRIGEVLARIADQKPLAGALIRVVAVDNNSTDGTLSELESIRSDFPLPLEVLHEAQQGKRYALEAALAVVSTNITAIVDDDNFIPSDYCQRVFDRFALDLAIGFLGVSTELEYEGDIPEWWESQASQFAVGRQGFTGYLDDHGRQVVWGAGMAFRTNLWFEAYAHYRSPLKGRNSTNLVAGEDSELCLLISLLGYRGYAEDDVVVGHRMSPVRMTEEYLLRLRWSLGYGQIENEMLVDEWLIRRGRFSSLKLALRRQRLFLLGYYRVVVAFLGVMSRIRTGIPAIKCRARQAGFRGCLDAVKKKRPADFWSFRFGNI